MTTGQINEQIGVDASGWNQSLFELKDGGHDDALNKDIQELVMVTDTFAVYLASDLSVQWRTKGERAWADDCGEVLNKVAVLETRSRFIADRQALAGIRRQIAEGLVRCLHEKKNDLAIIVLREAEIEIQARNKEISWSWYFQAAYAVTLTSVCGLAILWAFRHSLREFTGPIAFDVAMGTLCGAIGALLSVTTRGDRLHLDANAGLPIHRLEGLSRIGAGLAGAAFVALAIKSGLLLGGTHFAGSQFALLLTFCIGAGASERLVPSLLAKFETCDTKSTP